MRKNFRPNSLRFESLEGREMFSGGGLTTLAAPLAAPSAPSAYVASASVSAATVSTLPFGDTVRSTISAKGEVDTYKFTLNAPAKIQLELTGTAANGFVAKADVYDASGNWRCGVTAGGRWEGTLPAGTYSIKVHDKNHVKTGKYNIGLERMSAPWSKDHQNVPSFGTIISGSIDKLLQKNQYVFTLNAPTKVNIRLAGNNPTGFIAKADIYDASGNWRCGVTAGTAWEGTLPAGSYVLQVQDRNLAYNGSYTFNVERLSGPWNDNRQPIAVGTYRGGSIDNPIEKDQYTFSLAAATKIRLTLTNNSGSAIFGKADIYDSAGNWRCTVDAGGAWVGTLPAGDFVVRVYDRNFAYVGGYTLGLLKV
jgi:hypothetical protein